MRSKKQKLVELRGNLDLGLFPRDQFRYWTSDHDEVCQVWNIPIHGNTLTGFRNMSTGRWTFVEDHVKVFMARYADFFYDDIRGTFDDWFVEVR